MKTLFFLVTVALALSAQDPVRFTAKDGWNIYGDLYGKSGRGVLLVHGGRFNKESWAKQAKAIAAEGFQVLAIDLRGVGASKEGPPDRRNDIAMPLDLLAAIRFLQGNGARSVSIVGASMGGNLAEEAFRVSKPGEIDKIVFLAHGAFGPPQALKVNKLFVVAKDDMGPGNIPRLKRIQQQFDAAPDPKQLLVLEGDAHAQFLFQTDQGPRLLQAILNFLKS